MQTFCKGGARPCRANSVVLFKPIAEHADPCAISAMLAFGRLLEARNYCSCSIGGQEKVLNFSNALSKSRPSVFFL